MNRYQSLREFCHHYRTVALIGIPSSILSMVHGGIGVLHQGIGIFTIIRIDDDPDAGGGAKSVTLNQKRLPKGLKNLLGDLSRIVWPGYLW